MYNFNNRPGKKSRKTGVARPKQGSKHLNYYPILFHLHAWVSLELIGCNNVRMNLGLHG